MFATGEVGRKPGQRSTIHAEGNPKSFQKDLTVYRVKRRRKIEQDKSSSVTTVNRIKKIRKDADSSAQLDSSFVIISIIIVITGRFNAA